MSISLSLSEDDHSIDAIEFHFDYRGSDDGKGGTDSGTILEVMLDEHIPFTDPLIGYDQGLYRTDTRMLFDTSHVQTLFGAGFIHVMDDDDLPADFSFL